jgi:amino acid adenylation domain-containing protein/thioester reductase-like protein/non-ribosomal peptide synthase protein (TIGR01720 family)
MKDFSLLFGNAHMATVVNSKYENIYELSPLQGGLLFQALYQPEADVYLVQHVFELTNLNVDYWQKVWHIIINQHDSLKANFVWEKLSKPLQRIQREVDLLWLEEDWNGASNQEEKLHERLQLERKKTFDLSLSPLMRFNLIKIDCDKYYFVWNMHHLLVDGWSIPIILKDVITAYDSLINNEALKLKIRRPYKDYILWLLSQNQSHAIGYWQQSLLGAIPTLLGEKPIAEIDEYGELILTLNDEETRQLNRYARSLEVTSNTLLQGIWCLLLSKYKNQEDLLLGVTVSGRNIELSGVEDMVGLFINTLPIRIQLKPAETIKYLLKRLQTQMIEAQHYGFVPLSTIQAVIKERNLFDCIYVYENYPINTDLSYEKVNGNKLLIKPIQIIEKTEYKLSIAVIPKNELEIKLSYKKKFFSEKEIQNLLKYLKQLLFNIIANDNQRVGDISLLAKSDRDQLYDWNDTTKKYQNHCVHYSFEEIAKNNKNTAIFYEDAQLSYMELNERANQLAHYLREQGVQPDALVGIMCERSVEMIVIILGILKAGGAYVPIDPSYPNERIEFILDDTNISLLITQPDLVKKLALIKIKTIFLADVDDKLISYPTTNPSRIAQLNHLAYVIYTSGSTGVPRGVMVSHKNLSNSIKAQEEVLEIHRHKRMLQFASYTFDASVFEIFLALTTGMSLFQFNRDKIFDLNVFVQFANKHKIEFMALPPSFVLALPKDQFLHLKTLLLGGEIPPPLVVKQWRKNRQLINAYGPTECTVCVSTFSYQEETISSVIGRPLANSEIYILDPFLNPVPAGFFGEIYIAGEGLARGYLGKPSLTAEKFLPNPFAKNRECVGSRLYRTGDWGRYLENGTIEFLGRVDDQVKLRGFRIELGEIEHVIKSVKGVIQSVALIREDKENQKNLVVYLVLEDSNEKQIEKNSDQLEIISQCHEVCKARLPTYMQPSHIIILENLPLTLTGKIDKKALPKPQERKIDDNYEAPQGELEQQLAEIWQELLNVENIGRNDNFFSLGGDSIISIQMVSRARKMGIIIDVKQVFDIRTIAGLIRNIKKISEASLLNESSITGAVPLLPIQIWFFEKADNIHHFNQAGWLVPKAININLPADVEKLRIALEALCNHHDAFRLRFRKNNESWQQYYSDDPSVISFEIITKADWSEDKLAELCTEIQSNLDIEKGPLSRWVWFEGKGLFCVLHHLIVDGVSWRILLEDLNTLYEDKPLAIKSDSYKAWGEYVQEYTTLESTKEYYNNRPTIKLPLEETTTRINHVVTFTKEVTQTFIQEAQKAYHTQANDLLLTALVQAVGSYTDYRLCIELEGHGREVLGSELDLTRTIGWFTSLFPVYLELSEPTNLDKSIKEIKEQLRSVPEKGITYGIARYIKQELSEISNNISFNYLGQWDTIDTEGNAFKLGGERVGLCSEGNSKLFHKINILGGVKEGILSFEWESNCQESIIKELASDFKEKLEALIMHCSTGKAYGFTPSDFELVKLPQDKLDNLIHTSLIDIYPLSPIQGGLLFQNLYNPESDSYFIQSVFELKNLNTDAWQKAWHFVINRYDSLKASFVWKELEQPVQVIHKQVNLPWLNENWTVPTHDNQEPIEERLQKLLYLERRKGFDLNQAPLMRFNLIQIGEANYYFVWNMHHLLTDGWSGSIILSEVLKSYNLNHRQLNLIARRPFKDYLSWLLAQDQSKAKEFWQEYLLGVASTQLEGDAQLIGNEKQTEQVLILNKVETDKLNHYARSIEVTPSTILQGIWGILLSKYVRQADVVFGGVVSGRNIALSGIENMVGTFINTLPIRVQLKPHETIKEFMKRFQTQMSSIQEYGYVSLPDIQSLQNQGNLFDHIFAFENYPVFYDNKPDNLSLKLINVVEKTEYKLSITVIPTKQLEIKISYDEKSFSENYISELAKYLYRLIINITADKYQFIGNISLLDQLELAQRDKWNTTHWNYSIDQCVHQLFEKVLIANKDRVAVAYKDQQFTYELINQKANQLGHYLRKQEVINETRVGICVPRSLDLIIGFLGILKSGGVYVPLDPEYPADRLEYMLADAGVTILLTTTHLREKLKAFKGKIIFFENQEYGKESVNNLKNYSLPDSLAYIIYTSGSTGKPKGVTINHRSLINNIFWHSNQLNIHNAKILQRASSSFDASVWEIALSLIKGHSLIILPENNDVQADDLNNFIEKYECTLVQMTPSLIESFRLKSNRLIEQIVVGGEALTLEQVAIINQSMPHALLYNVYGATESCIDATYCLVDKNKDDITVGKPLHNMQIHILDEYLNPIPIGCIGEIYIGGIGLARGYLNRSSLTAEKFIPNPFTNLAGSRIYKTGDLGRYRADGEIEYLGRIDHQVKIRGFRIELGEIESAIQSIAEVNQCVVDIKEYNNHKRLVAYITSTVIHEASDEAQKKDIIDRCKEICRVKLPSYMQPNNVIILESLPLTSNGKVDRKTLPLPGDREGLINYESPSNEQERLICDAFAKVLKIATIGVHDDFFMLGGNSIQTIHLVVILQTHFDIKIKDIFSLRTPRRLALNSRFDKSILIKNLKQLQSLSTNIVNKHNKIDDWGKEKEHRYLKNLETSWKQDFDFIKKPITNVLLTGSTGFLGCNILKQLLDLTDYRIVLLIRANSQQEAMTRIAKKFQFYFHKSLDSFNSRILVIKADIEKENLDLSSLTYKTLVDQIDSVIHAAALVKHYGEWDNFYSANVQATINLLNLCKLTKLKDFHYISTCSVLSNGFISNVKGSMYSEDDLPNDLNLVDNVYVQTKLLAEREVVKYRNFNIKSSLYRTGNLAFISKNSQLQENSEDNAFLNWLKCLLNMKYFPIETNKCEISPADFTAQAIVKLFDKKNLDNNIYHLFNPHLFDISDAFGKFQRLKLMGVSINQFIDKIIQELDGRTVDSDLIVKFLLHQGWLDERIYTKSQPSKVLQERTNFILKQINFDWLPITQEVFEKCLNQLIINE